jgi:hypothetical protein
MAVGMLAACCYLHGGAASADDDRLQVHGFFSQTAAHTSDNNVGGNSDGGWGLDMREIGANVSYRPDADWLFSGQALARWAGNTDEGTPRLDYAFMDRTLFSGEDARVGVQLGKVKNGYGFFNTTRDVAHTRPGISMPQSIYLDRVRNFFLASPGVSLYGNHRQSAWDTSWTLNVMRPDTESEDLEHLFTLQALPGEYRGQRSWLAQFMTELDGGRLRMGLSFGTVSTRYHPGAIDLLGPGEQTLRPRLLSLEWNEEKWSLTTEYEQVKNSGNGYGLGGVGPEDPNTVEAWYVQGTYRVDANLHVYLRRDEFYFDKDDKSGASCAAANPLAPRHVCYAKDWVLGTKREWKGWSLSAEIHQVDGTAWLSPMDTPIANQKKDWRMVLFQAAYRF